ncbi:hypothetical protein COT78_01600 [Candidatus Berkelbacteria bacterium CG10_big_fil_rev_8_21_14_0_10_43_13]|uniref:Uncharacterized protein n=1 Tax=Candidatus Berkelbacteria bacterium CG10_big_fil_rev_8_21_14_0_10_43_13 TaxID=1974514 RepID=A0A2H0W8V1_9BACT|nr:MAG: hypothetical protein COT78_01600 [Candidatus Berkelbacteria bacterium CG10_big_fil_rev_8_21_14_0_10_43_13]
MNLSFLHQSSYWLATNSDMKGIYYTVYLVFFSLLFIFGIGIFMLSKSDLRKVWLRYATPFTLFGILGWIYLFATREELPGLSTRLTLLLIMSVFLLWILFLLGWSAKRVPKMIKEKKTEEKFSKYLPKTAKYENNTKLRKLR